MVQSTSSAPTLTFAGKSAIALFLLGCVGGAFYWARQKHMLPESVAVATGWQRC